MRPKSRSSNDILALVFILAIAAVSVPAQGQSYLSWSEHPRPLIIPLPEPAIWSGMSLARKNYAWLENKRVVPASIVEVDGKTLMLTFSQSWTCQRGLEPVNFQLRRTVDRHDFSSFRTTSRINEHWARSAMSSILKADSDKAKGLVRITVPIKFPKLVESLIGEGGASLQVNGSYTVKFDGTSRWDNRAQTAVYKQSKFPALNMEQISSFKIAGTIGSKIHVRVDQDSRRMSDLENNIQIWYEGTEDDIIQEFEAGNTSLSLKGGSLTGYPGGGAGGLFGIKAAGKLGNLGFTVITSQEKGNAESKEFVAGSSARPRTLRDYEYKARTFYDLGVLGTREDVIAGRAYFTPGYDEILDIKLYVNETDSERYQIFKGKALVDPNRPDSFATENWEGTWKEVERNDYDYLRDQFYIELSGYIRTDQNLACWMKVSRDGETFEVGSIADTTLTLMLLKRDNPVPTHRTFSYEWKNVYYLGARDLQTDGLSIRIFKGRPGDEERLDENSDAENSKRYVEILGLDRKDVSGNPRPDGKVDPEFIITENGYLYFPSREPFNSDSLQEPVPQIYRESDQRVIRENTKYFISVESRQVTQREDSYNLGAFNIIEGSEIVTLNGMNLVRGTDYEMYYEIGRIEFKNKDLDPNGDIRIAYSVKPLFALDKKSLFGTRLDYSSSPDFRIGTTLLFKSQKTTDRKARVGQEESRYAFWGTDFATRFDLPILTDIADALPLVTANAPSKVSISGEIAQVLPNPNIRGEAYIDDFEGSREAFSLSVMRRSWTKSSAPDSGSAYYNAGIDPRGKLLWYNPYEQTDITEIYPTEVQVRERGTHVLALEFRPDVSGGPRSWAGIMRAVPGAARNLTTTKYLEVRMLVPKNLPWGQLRIHLGAISEDINGNGVLDTEDINNDALYWEDTGLDGLFDKDEEGYDPITNPDPSGDNWHYSTDDPNNYEQINGTEGNRSDPEGGYLPDTEDINGNRYLDVLNAYYEWVLDFGEDSSRYFVPYSAYNPLNRDSEWRTYRFPIEVPDDSIGSPLIADIRFARVMLTGFQQTVNLRIAALDLVSTRWLADPVRSADGSSGGFAISMSDSSEAEFEVSIINGEISSKYNSPPGVTGERDPVTRIVEKEQSLLLKFSNFRPGDAARAQKRITPGENYAGYRRLKMFVHSTAHDTNTVFMFRMGSDERNYYEYRTPLINKGLRDKGPESFWDEENWVDIDLDRITQVKDSLKMLRMTDPEITYLFDSVSNLAVRLSGSAEPKITNISYFAMAVERSENAPQEPVSGEIWLDELRLTDVRRDKGLAARLSVSTDVSDLGRVSIDYSNSDPFFSMLAYKDKGNLGSGRQDTGLRVNASMQAGKLLPPSWGARIPVSYSWSRNLSVPRLISGSDIVVSAEDRESETTRNYSRSFSIRENFDKKTNNWLWKHVLNKFSSNLSLQSSHTKSPKQENRSETYTASGDYGLVPGNKSIRLLSWTSIIPFFPKAISNTQFGYLPSQMTFKGDLKRTQSLSRSQGYSSYDWSETERYERSFNGSMSAGYNPFSSLRTSFTFVTQRNLNDPEMVRLSLNPNKFRLGVELTRRQSFSADYGLKLVSFLPVTVKFSSSYNENSDPSRPSNSGGRREANNSSTLALSGTFGLKTFFGIGPKTERGFLPVRPFRWLVKPIVNRIDDIRLNYTDRNDFGTSGLTERPALAFQFGFTKDPGVPIDRSNQGAGGMSVIRYTDNRTRSYTAGTAVNFILGTKVNTNYRYSIGESVATGRTSKSTTFPDLGMTIGNLQKYKPLSWLFNSVSINSSYSRKLDESIADITGETEKKTISNSFSPLLGFNVTWLKSLTTKGTYDWSVSDALTFTAIGEQGNRTTTRDFRISTGYSFRSPTGFKIPVFGRVRFQSQLQLTIDVAHRLRKGDRIEPSGQLTPLTETTDLSISPRASYNFSSNIKGGMSMRWTDQTDKKRNLKSHVRQIGIWAEIRF